MVRLTTDALAVACILVGGAAGTAFTLAMLNDGRGDRGPDAVGMTHAVVSVERGPCVVVRTPRTVVTSRAPHVGHDVRVRASAVSSAPCSEIDRVSLEEARARMEAAAVRMEASRAQVEASRARLEAVRLERDGGPSHR